ncbi:UvrD-helicase domain-containing protein [Arundinibacter roseus]|uniref:DNA 3'-5' helicase n=1 Tax=Arundinibacter roseus TaxID=2070510 RepID=A0A4R4K9J8_9BACT|nr:ATP-dependent helicase [Arundinibacter roseus]TDB64360.1 ATP-dependent helicase [Arundinibacter roseus]
MKPTEQQKLILDYDGNSVIIAAPGSGKTFVISEKIKCHLRSLPEHQGVIAISYTNKASIELKNRSLSNGDNPKSSFFGTIDKFNLSEIIIPFAKYLFGVPSTDVKITKITSLSHDEIENFNWFNRKLTLEKISDSNIDLLKSYFLKGLIFIESIGVLANYVYTNSVACRNYIRARYKFIYIDEYQDSGFEQHQIFQKIKLLNIKAFAVGDLNQSIYAFSGKDAKYLEELTKDETFKYFKLDKNHRCHPSIINYSNYLLNPKTELISTENNLIFFSRVKGNEQAIAQWLDQNIKITQEAFKIEKRNQIAILTRTTRTGEIINNELKEPHKLSVSNELDTNLNVWSSIFSNLLSFGYDKNYKFNDVIELFTSYDNFSNSDLQKLKSSKEKIVNFFSSNTLNKEELIIEFINVAKIIAPNSKGQESIDLLKSVLENAIELKSYEPANENEVNILTLHKSKGLEYDFVFHLDLYEWVFPNKQPGNNNDFNNPIYGDWTQDLNLHYVGITRARKGCWLVSSTQRTNSEGISKKGNDSEFIWKDKIEDLRFPIT